MKKKRFHDAARFLFQFILAYWILLGLSANARIGEDRVIIERRIFKSGATYYRAYESIISRKKNTPYAKYEPYFPNGSEVRIYFKALDGKPIKPTDIEPRNDLTGWDFHVLYVNGSSALEFYKKTKGMSEYELFNLLSLQSGKSFWKKKTQQKDENPTVSAFGFDYERDDGKLRAKKIGGNVVMIYSTELDEILAVEKDEELKENAPQSVHGF